MPVNRHDRGWESLECHSEKSQHIWVQGGTINTLPDNVLLEVFNSYRQSSQDPGNRPWKWDMLIQVCRKWRNIVLASPLRLDLWLLCTHGTPVRRTLDCWPSLPIVIRYCASLEFRPPSPEDEDNVIAALEQHHRVREIQLAVTSSLLGKIVKLMQVSFPRLRHLSLWLDKDRSNGSVPGLPNSFLGEYAPRLRGLSLIGVPFPDLPGLLSSSRGLTSLRLLEVPDTGYISSHAMATCLSTLNDLAVLCLEFRFSKPRPNNERGYPLPLNRNRATLPNLTHFNFRGPSDYLEEILARIDAPFLHHVDITFFNQLIFQVPHLSHFIGRMEMLKSAKVAEMESSFGSGVSIKLDQGGSSSTQGTIGHPLSLCISCGVLEWQISSMAQICSQSSVFSHVKRLDVRADYLRLGYRWKDELESDPWLELFHSFTSVETLSISGELCLHVAHALEVVATEMVVAAEVLLPELRGLHFECSRKSASVENYDTVRKKFGRPVDVQHVSFPSPEMWDNVSDEKTMSDCRCRSLVSARPEGMLPPAQNQLLRAVLHSAHSVSPRGPVAYLTTRVAKSEPTQPWNWVSWLTRFGIALTSRVNLDTLLLLALTNPFDLLFTWNSPKTIYLSA